MRTEQLYYFLEAASCGSFSKAAENLYIKQPSLREGINNLEKEVGAKLFSTTNKGVKLTQYGEICLPIFSRIIQLYESTKLQNQEDTNTSLKIGLDLFANSLLNKFSSMQNTPYDSHLLIPTLQYTIYQNPSESFSKLLSQELDTVLLIMPNNTNIFSTALKAQIEHDTIKQIILPIEVFAIMSKNHPLAHNKKLTLFDFKPFLILTDTALQYPLSLYTHQQNINLNLQIVQSPTQSALIFFNNAICFSHNHSFDKVINLSNKPNIRKLSISHLFNFHLELYYLKNTKKQEQIKKLISVLQSFENYRDI